MTYLASLGEEVKIWDAFTFTFTDLLYSSDDSVKDVCWNPDGPLLASSSKNSKEVCVRKICNGRKLSVTHTFQLPNSCSCLDFASRYLLAGCENGALHILDMQTTKLHKTFNSKKLAIVVARWNWNDQNIAFGCQTGQIVLYNVITGQASSPFKPFSSQTISQLRYNPYCKSSLASASEDGVVSFWDTNTRSLVHSFKSDHQAPATDLAFSPVNDQLMLSTGLDKRLVLYDVQGKKSMQTIVADYPLTCLDMLDGSMVAVGTSRGKILMYDLRKAGVPVLTIPAHKSSVQRVSFSRKEIVTAGENSYREVLSSVYSENNAGTIHDSAHHNSTGHHQTSGTGLPSFLRDQSSSYLSEANNNTHNSSLAHMSPNSKSLAYLNSGSNLMGSDVAGASHLYSFLHNESSHHSRRSEADNTGGSYLMELNDSNHRPTQMYNSVQDQLSEHIPKASPIIAGISGGMRTPPHPSPHAWSPRGNTANWSLSPCLDNTDRTREQPQASLSNGVLSPTSSQVSNRARIKDSSNTTAVTPPNQRQRIMEESFSRSLRKIHGKSSSSPEKTDGDQISSSSLEDVHQMLGEIMKKEMHELKVEVKAIIKAGLKEPQGMVRPSPGNVQCEGEGEVQNESSGNPHMFQEEYLRRLIRDELEDMMEKSHKDSLNVVAEMHRLHSQMWWWLDHRFSEQLLNPAVLEPLRRLEEEVKRLRCSYKL